jgi:hypothetical protein
MRATCLILASVLAAPPRPSYRPDPVLTPGAGEVVPIATLCAPGFTGPRRHVTAAMKRRVYLSYGLVPVEPYVIDHLVPLEIGGTNDVTNLWPQPVKGLYGSKAKDRLEGALKRDVCDGKVKLEAAQRAFQGDWTRAYRRRFGALKTGG